MHIEEMCAFWKKAARGQTLRLQFAKGPSVPAMERRVMHYIFSTRILLFLAIHTFDFPFLTTIWTFYES